ncbi:MAG: hypothetical protein R2788_15500 [Saprospiraceae bacterium]
MSKELNYKEIKQQAIQLLAQGDDLKLIMNFLFEKLKGDRHHSNDIILLTARLSSMESEKKKGLLTDEQYQVGKNKIQYGLTSFVNNLDQPKKITARPFEINKELLVLFSAIVQLLSLIALVYIIYLLKNL